MANPQPAAAGAAPCGNCGPSTPQASRRTVARSDHRHAHQHPQRVTRHIVRRLGRTAGKLSQVRVMLPLEHRLGERPGRLRQLDDVRAGGVLLAAGGERCGGPVDLDIGGAQDPEHLARLVRIALLGRDDEGERRLLAVHPVGVDPVEVLEPLRPVFRDVRHPREGHRVAVVDDIAEAPVAGAIGQREVPARLLRTDRAGLRDDRVGQVHARDLGQDARLAVVDHVLPRRRPQVVAREELDAPLSFRHQRRRHRLPHRHDALRDDRVHVGIVGVVERRHEDARAAGAHLVHVMGDDRLVLVLDLDREPGFLLGEHEPVAVVVVADILVVEVRIHPVEGGALRLVPVVDDEVLPVGILRRHEQDDDVVEDLLDLGAGVGGEAVRDLDQRLRVADLGRVNGAVDEIERPPLLRQALGLGGREAARVGEAAVDLDQPIELRQVLRRADRRQHVGVPHRRLAALFVFQAAGRLRQVLQVFQDLGYRASSPSAPMWKPKNWSGDCVEDGRGDCAEGERPASATSAAANRERSMRTSAANHTSGGRQPLSRCTADGCYHEEARRPRRARSKPDLLRVLRELRASSCLRRKRRDRRRIPNYG